jgi:hypothetical protein
MRDGLLPARSAGLRAPEVQERKPVAAAYAADDAVDEAEKVQHKALEDVCGHRCGSHEEFAMKMRYLASWGGGLEEDQAAALYKSLLPEGEDIDAV